jgi:hypothetical protein
MEESVLWVCDQTYINEATASARNSFCFSRMSETISILRKWTELQIRRDIRVGPSVKNSDSDWD